MGEVPDPEKQKLGKRSGHLGFFQLGYTLINSLALAMAYDQQFRKPD
jgi:hypothetical protein